MKLLQKIAFSLSVAVYFLAATGIPVYLHYCGDELAAVSYFSSSNGCCDDSSDCSDDAGSCCHNENLMVKAAIDHTIKQSPSTNNAAKAPAVTPGRFSATPLFSVLHPAVSLPAISFALQQKKTVDTTVLRI